MSQADQARAAFSQCPSWEARARLLMQWGEQLAPVNEAERTEANRVHGCESAVWLVADAPTHFRATSDARLIRGLLALLLVRLEGLSAQDIQALDVGQWFTELGLGKYLSPSRSNGLNAVLKRIQTLVA